MEKRGLSNIIVTLLIIVLSLIAISVVWGVVRNIITEGTEQIELGKFTLDLEIKSVKVQGDEVTVDVIVQRNPGKGEFIGINFVFSDGQNSEVIREDIVLKELDEKSFTFSLTKINTSELEEVSIAPIYELKSGKEDMGNIADKFKVSVTGGVISEALGGNFEKYGPVGAGRTSYTISSGEEDIPEFTNIIIDPLDVKVGEIQTFIAYVTSPNEITEVTTRTQLDNEILILPLEKTDNPNEYMASWTVYDTHSQIYRTNFTARDSAGNENTVSMSWTDPCTSLGDHGNLVIISSPCSVSVVDGVDEGNIRVDTGGSITLNSGGIFIYTPGFSVSFTGGKIIKASGGALKKAYLYYNDADGDSHGSGYDWSTSTTFAGHVRANLAIGDFDCLDTGTNASNVYQQIGSLGLDADNDRYTTGSSATRCVGNKSSFWYKDVDGTNKWITTADDLGTGNDCDDNNGALLNLEWGSGVANGQTCFFDGLNPSSGACSPVSSTNDYTPSIFHQTACGGEPHFNKFTQTCNSC